MTFLLFPDNTVLVNFAVMGRVDLLADLVQDRGGWTLTVSGECRRSAAEPGLEALAGMNDIFGDPLIPSPAERIDARMHHARLAGPEDGPRQHYGEAEALAIMSSRDLRAVFVTDDKAAQELAAGLGVRTYSTVDLVRLAVRARRLTVDAAWALVELLRAKKRAVRGVPTTFAAFEGWCTG